VILLFTECEITPSRIKSFSGNQRVIGAM